MKKYIKIILAILTVALTVFAAYKLLHGPVTPQQLSELLKHFPLTILGGLLLLATGMYLVRAYRFYLLLTDSQVKITVWQAVKVYLSGQALSPLPAGESSRSLLVHIETGQSAKKTITPLILLGVTEMIVAVLITMIGSLFLGVLRLIASIALIGVLGLGWLLINHKAVALLIRKAPDDSTVKKAGKAVMKRQKEVHAAAFKSQSWLPSKLLIENILLALLSSLLGGMIIFSIAHYYHLPLSYLWCFYIFAASTVLGELLPFVPGGIGVTEGGMTGILLFAGISLSQAVAVVIVFRAATLVYGFLLGVVSILVFYSKKYFEKTN